MASRLTFLSLSVALLSILAWGYINIFAVLDAVGGRVSIDKARLVRWEKNPPLNNGDCKVNELANGCEDVKIHYASSTAFLACGDPVERSQWYPPAGVRTVSRRSSFREQLFKYDIKKAKTTELKIHGLDGDFITHGIDVYSFPEDSSKVYIYAVNHARAGDSIVIFEHKMGSDDVYVVQNVKHPNIKTVNGVAATGPLTFYFTNDHYFEKGLPRDLEESWGPWSWASHVQYCDASGETVRCDQVSESVPGANGLAVYEKQLYLGDSKNGTLSVFDIQSERKLRRTHVIDLGAAADNVRVLPTGDPIVAIFPTLENLPLYLLNVPSLGKDFRVPAGAVRLRRDRDFAPELVYFDDGSVLSFMTAAAIDPTNRLFIGAALLQYGGFAVCKLPAKFDLS